MTPPREDNYQVAEVLNVTTAPNISSNAAVNRIVINTMEELLSMDNTRTVTRILLVVLVIYLFLCLIIATLCPSQFDNDETEDDIDELRLR